jgi:hypothetical protein
MTTIKTKPKGFCPNDISQILHNEGVEFDKRYSIILDILYDKPNNDVKDSIISKVRKELDESNINKNELFQIIYMFFGNKFFKKQLDQYYTPITICDMINACMIPDKSAIDPACGTGDLINYYHGRRILCDISADVIEITKFVSTSSEIRNIDSLKYFMNHTYDRFDYCVMNPPFGTKTVVEDLEVLKHYEIGTCKKKQEIGMLFIELGLKLLAENGILFAIVPNGYLGNTNENYIGLRKIIDSYKIIGVIKFPDDAFSRSGTGVGTSLLIIQNCTPDIDYNIFIGSAENIGYQLNKQNTPFKYKVDEKGYYFVDDNQKLIIDNDFDFISKQFKTFVKNENIPNLNTVDESYEYETVRRSELGKYLMLDIKRYIDVYKNIINNPINSKKIQDYCRKSSDKFSKKDETTYNYIDIGCVSTPIYKYKKCAGNELPSRAKYPVKNGDIIVSKLKGNISFAIITTDTPNLIVSNGFTVLRPMTKKGTYIVFANLFTKDFSIQHQSMVTGSIMETLTDEDVIDIRINPEIDIKKYENIVKSLSTINNLLRE